MWKKSGKWLIMAASLLLLLGGCARREEEPWVPEETALQIAEEGFVTETIVDELDQSYYDPQELESMIRSQTDAYNRAHGRDAVTLQEYTAQDGRVLTRIRYESTADYEDFNETPAFNGTILGAQMEGYRFKEDFVKVKKGIPDQQTVPGSEVLAHKEYQVAVADGSYAVEVPGNIVYYSANAVLVSGRVVRPSGIVIEGSDEDTAAESLIYVIYE